LREPVGRQEGRKSLRCLNGRTGKTFVTKTREELRGRGGKQGWKRGTAALKVEASNRKEKKKMVSL